MKVINFFNNERIFIVGILCIIKLISNYLIVKVYILSVRRFLLIFVFFIFVCLLEFEVLVFRLLFTEKFRLNKNILNFVIDIFLMIFND